MCAPAFYSGRDRTAVGRVTSADQKKSGSSSNTVRQPIGKCAKSSRTELLPDFFLFWSMDGERDALDPRSQQTETGPASSAIAASFVVNNSWARKHYTTVWIRRQRKSQHPKKRLRKKNVDRPLSPSFLISRKPKKKLQVWLVAHSDLT